MVSRRRDCCKDISRIIFCHTLHDQQVMYKLFHCSILRLFKAHRAEQKPLSAAINLMYKLFIAHFFAHFFAHRVE